MPIHRLTGAYCPFPIVGVRELCDFELLNKRSHCNQNYPEIIQTTALSTVVQPIVKIGAPDRVNLHSRIQRDRMSNPLKVAIDFVETTQLLSNLNSMIRLLTPDQLQSSKVTKLLNIADTYNIIKMQLGKLRQPHEIVRTRSRFLSHSIENSVPSENNETVMEVAKVHKDYLDTLLTTLSETCLHR